MIPSGGLRLFLTAEMNASVFTGLGPLDDSYALSPDSFVLLQRCSFYALDSLGLTVSYY